jgi:RNA-directed DNA polymerase
VLSPLLANIGLNPLDHLLTDAGFALVRYADDLVILCKTREAAEAALERLQRWVDENELALHPTKTKIVEARTEGFDLLGDHFCGSLRLPRTKRLQKFKDTVRQRTKRTNGHSMPHWCARLSAQLRG